MFGVFQLDYEWIIDEKELDEYNCHEWLNSDNFADDSISFYLVGKSDAFFWITIL